MEDENLVIGEFDEYKGYTGSIECMNQLYHGTILNIDDTISYSAQSVEELFIEYHKAIDSYLIMIGK